MAFSYAPVANISPVPREDDTLRLAYVKAATALILSRRALEIGAEEHGPILCVAVSYVALLERRYASGEASAVSSGFELGEACATYLVSMGTELDGASIANMPRVALERKAWETLLISIAHYGARDLLTAFQADRIHRVQAPECGL